MLARSKPAALIGIRPEIVFLNEWLLEQRTNEVESREQAVLLEPLRNSLLSDYLFVVITSLPRSSELAIERAPWLMTRTPIQVGVSKARRAAVSAFRDSRIGSFPNFRLSTGLSPMALLLKTGAKEEELFGFDPLGSISLSGSTASHSLADSYAIILKAAGRRRLRIKSSHLQKLQDNWAGKKPEWAKRNMKNLIYFSGLFWS